ncbi:MAG TPA: DUF4432 family protein, partial [Chloroflexota bacterium]|nr:DUF4432 family protein [Chloroflexota bacterium]
SSLPWDVRIVEDLAERIAVEFSVRGRRTPFWLRRTMILERETPFVRLDETLVNEGEEPVPFMWGHHPAFGPPLISADCVIDLPPAPFIVSANQQHGRYVPGRHETWPLARDRQGQPLDASLVPPKDARAVDTLYAELTGQQKGYAAIRNQALGLGVGLDWDAAVFPYVWCWQAYGGAWGYPYYGRTYHVAIEPFNAPIGSLEDAIRTGTGGRLDPSGEVSTTLRAGAVDGATPFTGF